MSSAYTIFWNKDFWRQVRGEGDEGHPLTVLFGGIHTSCPSLERARIEPGDTVFPVGVHDGQLHIFAGGTAGPIVDMNFYLRECLHCEDHNINSYERMHGPVGHRVRMGICGIHALLVENATPIQFDVIVPPELLPSVTFAPRKGDEVGLCSLENGRLKSAISLHGHVRRLSAPTTKLFRNLIGMDREYEWNPGPAAVQFELPL